jgi:phosphoglycerate dehydrogenase-like enzyme
MAPAVPSIIWCNLPLVGAARARLEAALGDRLLWARNIAPGNVQTGSADPALPGADIAFGQPHGPQCAELARLQWVHLSSAGFTSFDVPTVGPVLAARGSRVTASSAVYADPCAQHVLAFLLAQARHLPDAVVNQHDSRGWPKKVMRTTSDRLHGQTVLLVGMGHIARRLCQLLAPFGVNIIGVRRRPRGDDPVRTVASRDIDEHLPAADVVVDLLPGNDETSRFFDASRFGRMKPGAIFINIGRGTTVEQTALCSALTGGLLGAAYLDVTDPEPLPSDHALWSAPRCVITPHSAGGHRDEFDRLVALFLENLDRFDRGQALRDQVI